MPFHGPRATSRTSRRSGVVGKGKPKSDDPKVTALSLDKKVPAATITDCLDISGWKRVDQKTGKEVAPPKDALSRYVTVVSAERWGNQWTILKVDSKPQKC